MILTLAKQHPTPGQNSSLGTTQLWRAQTHAHAHTPTTLDKQRTEHAGAFNVRLGSRLVMHLDTR